LLLHQTKATTIAYSHTPKMLQKLDALRSIFHVSCTTLLLLLLFLPGKMLREEGGKEAWQSRKKR
jgi:hypothetical protein